MYTNKQTSTQVKLRALVQSAQSLQSMLELLQSPGYLTSFVSACDDSKFPRSEKECL